MAVAGTSSITLIPEFFGTISRYWEYIKQSVARDLRKRYKRSFLGYLWSMLNPLLMMIILAVVFSNLMRSQIEAYAVFLFTGQLTFAYFSETVMNSLDSISNNMNLMKQVPVPKFVFPVANAFSNLANFMLTLVPLLLVMLVMGVPFRPSILLLPFILLPLFCFTVGVALIFSASNVFFKDTQHLSDVLMKALYFLCPILYGREHLPEWLITWLVLNPLFLMIEHMRSIFYLGVAPDLSSYLISTTTSLLVLMAGLWIFKKSDDKFIYFV